MDVTMNKPYQFHGFGEKGPCVRIMETPTNLVQATEKALAEGLLMVEMIKYWAFLSGE